MSTSNSELISAVAAYYSGKLQQHGAIPAGVDWNGSESQTLRFEQLCKLLPWDGGFSIADIGCGYGALFSYLKQHFAAFSYIGVDVAAAMIEKALQSVDDLSASFVVGNTLEEPVDYCVASGIFNVKMEASDSTWQQYIYSCLDSLNQSSLKGFAFNILTSYADTDKQRPYLYYAKPEELFAFCKKHYSRNIALLHDYNLYEFTILVRK